MWYRLGANGKWEEYLKESTGWVGREVTGLCIENSSRQYVGLTVQVYKEKKKILGQSAKTDYLEKEEFELDIKVWAKVR